QTCRSHFVKNDGMSDGADYRNWVAALLLDHDRDLRMHYQSVDLQQFLDSFAQLKRRAPGDRKALGNQGQRDESGRIHANVTGKIGHIENVDVYHVSRAEGNLSHRRARRLRELLNSSVRLLRSLHFILAEAGLSPAQKEKDQPDRARPYAVQRLLDRRSHESTKTPAKTMNYGLTQSQCPKSCTIL